MAMSPVMGDKRKEPEGADDGKVWWQAGREDAKAGRGAAAQWRAQRKNAWQLQTDGDLRKRRKMEPPGKIFKEEEKYQQERCVKM